VRVAERLLAQYTLAPNEALAEGVRAFRRHHPDDFHDHIVVFRERASVTGDEGEGGETATAAAPAVVAYHIVAWWRAERLEDYANSEFYFVVNVDGAFEDRSDGVLDVSADPAPPEMRGAPLVIPLLEETPAEPGSGEPAAEIMPAAAGEGAVPAAAPQSTSPPRWAGISAPAPATPPAEELPALPQLEWPLSHPEPHPVAKDTVHDGPSPFAGRLVAIFPRWEAVSVESAQDKFSGVAYHRYATSYDLARAYWWGTYLFGARSFVILEGPARIPSSPSPNKTRYYVLPLNYTLSLRSLAAGREDVGGRQYRGVRVRYWQIQHPDSSGAYHFVRVLGTFDDSIILPTYPPVLALEWQRQVERRPGFVENTIPRALAKRAVFRDIERGVTAGDTERAAALLAHLDHNAFELLEAKERRDYLILLLDAYTYAPQERAVVEIIRGVDEKRPEELDDLVGELAAKGMLTKLVEDLDAELWDLLVTVGEKFGGEVVIDLEFLAGLLSDVMLTGPGGIGRAILPAGTRPRINADGSVEITEDYLSELYSAASSFVRFVEGTFEGIWTLVTEPQKVVEGIIQLVKLAVAVQLALLGHRESQEYVAQITRAISTKIVAGLKGAYRLKVTDQVIRRIKWTILWEVLSIVVTPAAAAAGVTSLLNRTGAVARFLRVFGLTEQATARFQRLASLLARTGSLGEANDVMRLMSHLPADDVGRLERLLARADVEDIQSLESLVARADPELVKALEQLRPRLETLGVLERKLGGALSDAATEGFGRLATDFSLDSAQLRQIVDLCHPDHAEPFLRAVRQLPAPSAAEQAARRVDFLRNLAEHPNAASLIAEEGYPLYAALSRQAGGDFLRTEQRIGALNTVRRQVLQEGDSGDYARFLDLVNADDVGALARLRAAGRANHIAGRYPPDVVELVSRALADADADVPTRLADIRKRLRGLDIPGDEVARLERRILLYRTADRLDLTTHVPNMTAAERLALEALDADDWERILSRGQSNVNAFLSPDAKTRQGAISGVKGTIAEEFFYDSPEFTQALARARKRADAEGIDPSKVRFVRGASDRYQDVSDGLFVAEAKDGKMRILTVIESKSPSNRKDVSWYTGENTGQLEADFGRFETGKTTIEGRTWEADDIIVGGSRTEWVVVTPPGSPLSRRARQHLEDVRGGTLNLVEVAGVVRDDVVNRITERVLQLLSAP